MAFQIRQNGYLCIHHNEHSGWTFARIIWNDSVIKTLVSFVHDLDSLSHLDQGPRRFILRLLQWRFLRGGDDLALNLLRHGLHELSFRDLVAQTLGCQKIVISLFFSMLNWCFGGKKLLYISQKSDCFKDRNRKIGDKYLLHQITERSLRQRRWTVTSDVQVWRGAWHGYQSFSHCLRNQKWIIDCLQFIKLLVWSDV